MGLVAGLVGALLMFYFPPRIPLYTENDEPHITFVGNPKEDKAGAGRRQSRLARLGPFLLVLAFLLQLLAILIANSHPIAS